MGGAGDDVLAISDEDFKRIDGGRGIDSLRLDNGMELDLTDVPDGRIRNVEQIEGFCRGLLSGSVSGFGIASELLAA